MSVIRSAGTLIPGLPSAAALAPAALADRAAYGSAEMPPPAPTAGNRVRLLVDERAVVPRLVAAIRSARHQIDVHMFIWEPSGAGRIIAEELKRAARRGVRISVQIDQVGSLQVPGTRHTQLFADLERAGIRVQLNRRIRFPGGMNAVDHSKSMVIDGRLAFAGGMNLSGKFSAWHDVMVEMEGPAAARLAALQVSRWVDEGGSISPAQRRSIERGVRPAADAYSAVAVLANVPDGRLDATDHFFAVVAGARRRVWVQTPFLTEPRVVEALVAAARRGIDVRVAVSGDDSALIAKPLQKLSTLHFNDLVDAGVKVYEQPGMSHAKVWLVDDVATVGSMNLSRRATRYDHELSVVVRGGALPSQLEAMFRRDFRRSDPVTAAEAHEHPLLARIRDIFDVRY